LIIVIRIETIPAPVKLNRNNKSQHHCYDFFPNNILQKNMRVMIKLIEELVILRIGVIMALLCEMVCLVIVIRTETVSAYVKKIRYN
jgi:hypothetical protein